MSGSVAVTRAIAVPGLLLLLIIATALSLLIGAKSLPASVVLEAFSGTCQSADCTIVLDARLPRTLAGLLAGGALGLAGALMQTLTRNPLADPGLLGVNAGASFAIVLGAALFGYSSAQEQLAMAFAGALVASLIVAFTGSQGGGQLSPVRLTLAGVALAEGASMGPRRACGRCAWTRKRRGFYQWPCFRDPFLTPAGARWPKGVADGGRRWPPCTAISPQIGPEKYRRR